MFTSPRREARSSDRCFKAKKIAVQASLVIPFRLGDRILVLQSCANVQSYFQLEQCVEYHTPVEAAKPHLEQRHLLPPCNGPPTMAMISALRVSAYFLTVVSGFAQFILKPEDAIVELNSKVTFLCQAERKVIWQRNSRPISHARYNTVTGANGLTVVRIEPVRDRDNNSEISCVIEENDKRIAEATAKLIVLQEAQLAYGFPKIVEEPELRTVERGGSATLTCRVSGDPKPSILWLRDRLPVNMSNRRYSISTIGSLVIQQTEESDEGRYECMARNKHGVAHSRSAHLYVRVRRVSPYFSRPPEGRYQVMPGGNVNLTCVAVGHPMPRVFWRRGNGEDLEDPSNAPHGVNTLQLRNLHQTENYSCIAFSNLGNIEAQSTVEVKDLAYPPTNLNIVGQTARSVTLKWDRVSSSADYAVLYYVVEYRSKYSDGSDFMELKALNETEVTVGKLEPFTQYEFQVRTVTPVGRSLPSRPVEATTSEEVPQNQPKNVHSRAVSPTSVMVQWEPPDKANGVILGYAIFYTSRPAEPFNMWLTKENVVYTVRVQARNSVGYGPISEPVSVLTQPGIPGQPQNVKATAIGAKRMLLTWESPLFSSDVTNYLIRYNHTPSKFVNEQMGSALTEKVIENLLPNTDYTFQVSAKSQRGEGLFSRPVLQRTNPSAPSGPPEGVVVETISSRELRVIWEPPPKNQQHGLISSYKVFWELISTEDNDDNVEDDDEEDEDDEAQNGSLTQPADKQRSVTIGNLKPYTQYRVAVAAGTVKGFGPRSEPVTAQTNDDVPGAPRHLTVKTLNSSSVHVSWQEPKHKNGRLVGYSVFVEELDEDGFPLYSIISHPARRVGGDQNETYIHGLRPSANYSFRVNAYNRKGDGFFTKTHIVSMPALPPSAPRSISTELLQVEKPVRLRLKWTEPAKTFGDPILRYRIRYRTTDVVGSFTTLMVNANQMSAIVEPLNNGRTYEFHLAAENAQGTGEEGVVKITTPTAVPTGPPFDLRYEFDTVDKRLQFTWEPPNMEERNGEIVRYQTRFVLPDGKENILREVQRNSVSFLISRLGSTYNFSVRASTSKGYGPWSDPIVVKAQWNREIAQMTVKNITAQAMSSSSALVTWKPIGDKRVRGYKVHYTQEPSNKSWRDKEIMDPAADRLLIDGLKQNEHYAFCVRTILVDGAVSECSENAFEAIQPRYVIHDLTEERLHSSFVQLRWQYDGPRPASFYVKYRGRKRYRAQINEWKELSIDGLTIETDQLWLNATNLRPYTNYTFDVGVIWTNGTNRRYYLPHTIDVTTRKSVPPFITAPAVVDSINSKEARIRLEAATEEYGPVSHYWLIVVSADTSRLPDKIENKEVLHAKTHHPLPGDPYVAARLSRDDILNLKDGIFVLGNGLRYGDFTNFPLNNRARYKVFLRAFLENEGDDGSYEPGFASSMYSTEFVTLTLMASPKAAGSSLWLVGPIVAIIVVGLIIGIICLFLFRRSKKNKLPVKHGSINKVALGPIGPSETSKLLKDGQASTGIVNGFGLKTYQGVMADMYHAGDPVEMQTLYYPQPPPTVASTVSHAPIPIIELADHIERLKANDNLLFSKEYESIETGQHSTWDHSNLECNKPKNRYANVVAYDHSRVVLSPVNGSPGSDYINANYIDGYVKSKAYIATQGPMAETFGDFWRMVWEEKSATIVMLTKLEERTRIKCDQYWPNRSSATYGCVHVVVKEVTEFAYYTLRLIQICRVGQSEWRDVRHLQFTAWPDHGVPEHPTAFLMFLKHVKSVNPPESGPIIVHCSAGVGRTGALIVVDIMLDRLRYENTVDIYGCVAAIRSQRSYMVQTEEQYVFIHDAVLDAVQSGCTEVPVSKLMLHIENLLQYQAVENATGMELEFRHLSALKFPNARFTVANLPCNKLKNRLVNVVPYDSSRVYLTPISSVEGSDYINASFIDGYRQRKMYIATQGPMSNTRDDFWRMLWEHNCTIIVMLTKLRELGREKCCQYWPQDHGERFGYLVVEPIAEYNMPQYVLREFKLADSRNGQSKTVRHFQYTEWPEQGVPKSSDLLVDFVGQVHKTRQQFGQEGPIVVHCSTGVGRTGVFIALSIVLERIRFECVVDIFTVVKLLRAQRPNMVQSEDQYHFLHKAAMEYLGSFDHLQPSQC
uniref:protein-tyrosine-phosphatase n=1 Tax=Trichuris muris TaxID=70415 RepID=A0A5S6QAL2_TRIMR